MVEKMIRRDFAGSIDEAKKSYKIGQIVEFNGRKYKVDSIDDAVESTCFASFPSVYFRLVK